MADVDLLYRVGSGSLIETTIGNTVRFKLLVLFVLLATVFYLLI